MWPEECQVRDFVLLIEPALAYFQILWDRLNILLPEESLDHDLDCPKPEGLQMDSVAKSLMALLTQSLEDLAIILKNESSKADELCARLQDLGKRTTSRPSRSPKYLISSRLIF